LSCFFLPVAVAEKDVDYTELGPNTTGRMVEGVAVTEGVVRVRRRHENDMDFAKYNPFYWEGRLTRFKVEDYTPLGEKKIVFSLFTEWPQDYTKYRGPDFSAIYLGDPLANETLRSKFAVNTRMKHIGGERKHFEATLEGGRFDVSSEELKPGKLLTFEYRFFNDEAHPGWAIQKKRNAHNLSAYYSEFFRIEVGKPGLFIDDGMAPAGTKPGAPQLNRHPEIARYTGGWTTIPSMRVEPWSGLQQQAFNLSPNNSQAFLTGRTWFHTDLKTGKHRSDASDDKPSRFFQAMVDERKGYAAGAYNATSCNQCHLHNGRSNLPELGPDLRLPSSPLHTTITKLHSRAHGGPLKKFGAQLQTDGDDAEGQLLLQGIESKTVRLQDGSSVELVRPVFSVSTGDGESLIDAGLSVRTTPALVGAGLLDAVPDAQLRVNQAASLTGGQVRDVGGEIGRFGWKANQPTLEAQIRDALLNDMGVKSAGSEQLDGAFDGGKALLPEQAINELETYVALLGVPPRDNPSDPAVVRGAALFKTVGCADCHLPSMKTAASKFSELAHQTIHPYTDLLLHDLGDGLADDSKAADARLWRTAPLWGLKNMRAAKNAYRDKFKPGDTHVTYADTQAAAKTNPVQLLHDGRARSMPEAILWHGGSATPAVEKYKALNKSKRDDLEAFLWDL